MNMIQQQHRIKETLYQYLLKYGDAAGIEWLEQSRDRIRQEENYAMILEITLAMARRKINSDRLAGDLQLDLPLTSMSSNGDFQVLSWTLSDVARNYLILDVLTDKQCKSDKLLQSVYQQGDEIERAAIVKGLCVTDPLGSWRSSAIDVARTNSVNLFTALALCNLYPAVYFCEAAFNQLVLKALFLQLNIDNIWGLQERVGTELSRMCSDYIEECDDASRQHPLSIWLALTGLDLERFSEKWCDILYNGRIEERQFVLRALTNYPASAKGSVDFICQCCDKEADNSVLQLHKALQHALENA